MLWTIAVILLVLWLLGMVSSYTLGGFIHILLVLAIIAVLVRPHPRSQPGLAHRLGSYADPRGVLLLFGQGNKWSASGPHLMRGAIIMDKDRVEGKVKDVAGRVERQVGEWTGDSEKQAHARLSKPKAKCKTLGQGKRCRQRRHQGKSRRQCRGRRGRRTKNQVRAQSRLTSPAGVSKPFLPKLPPGEVCRVAFFASSGQAVKDGQASGGSRPQSLPRAPCALE